MGPTSWLEINLSRIDANLATFRALLGGVTAGSNAPASAGAQAPAQPAPIPHAGSAAAAGALATATTDRIRAAGRDGVVYPVATTTEPSPSRRTGPPGPPGPLLCGVVKADAYGLGVLPIAQRLASRGIDMLAVYSPAQAEHLATATLHCPILVLMRMSELGRGDPLYRHAMTGRLHLSIHDRGQLQDLDRAGRMLGVRVPVHLYIDTGMSRAGLSIDDLAGALSDLSISRHLRLAGIYTHLASSESDADFTAEQVDRLEKAIEDHRPLLPAQSDMVVHVANTCAVLRDRRYHQGLVRVGLGLYGYGPEQMAPGACALPAGKRLQHVVRWLSRVIHVQRYAKGTPVGYGSTTRLARDSVLGLVPVGYAEGYPLSLSGASSVGVLEAGAAGPAITGGTSGGTATPPGAPKLARVLGRVNMDQIVIDLTDLSGAGIGSPVELISDDANSPWSLPQLARLAGSSCYEMLCRLSPRVPRRYV